MPRTPTTARTLLIALLTLAVTVLGAGGPAWASTPAAGATPGSGPWSAPVLPLRLAHPFAPPAQPWLSGHRGIDLLAAAGSDVTAVDDGVVVFAGAVAGMPVVTVLHDHGVRSTYQPVEAEVAVGDVVLAGQTLGTLAQAGSHCAPASCLHLGAKRGQTYLDPALLVGLRGPRLLPHLSTPSELGPDPSYDVSVPPDLAPGLSASLNPAAPAEAAAEPDPAGAAHARAPTEAARPETGPIEQVVAVLTHILAAVESATVLM